MKKPSIINPEDIADLSHDAIQEYRKSSPKTKDIVAVVLFATVSILCLLVSLVFNNAFGAATETVSSVAGTVAGILDGTAESPQKYREGKEVGLSAEDTHASIATKFSDVGKLDVLVSGVTVTDLHKFSDKYAGLYVSKGYAVFSVNLSSADISVTDESVTITIERPNCDVYIDESSTEKLAEWSHSIWNGAEKDGYFAYLNSWAKSREELENSIEDYESLIDLARSSADSQLKMLVKTVNTSAKKVIVNFKEPANE